MVTHSNDPCRMHPGQVAVTCAECYDKALRQQEAQVRRERQEAHQAYLERLTVVE